MAVAECRVRPVTADDVPALQSALAWAISWRTSELSVAPHEHIVATGHEYLLEGWGRPGDAGVIAECPTGPVGAAWYRFWTQAVHSYGYVDPAIPDMGIGVDPAWRGRGVGTMLVEALLAQAAECDVSAVSLSVEEENAVALRLYERAGFEPVGRASGAWTMVRRLDREREQRDVTGDDSG